MASNEAEPSKEGEMGADLAANEVKSQPEENDIGLEFARTCNVSDDNQNSGPSPDPRSEREPDIAHDVAGEEARDWFVDEDYLRDHDKDLSDEDKQERRDNSEKLKTEGNEHFKNASYEEAARSYTTALRTCPFSCSNERAILYSNRAACFLYMDKKEEGIMDCSKALEYNPVFLRAVMRRALLYEKAEKLDDALEDYKKVLELEPRNPKAIEACMRLPAEINERNEKLKSEMMGKLKDLGNMFLKPFGLSTDNFKMQQDPETGSYSVNMQQNK